MPQPPPLPQDMKTPCPPSYHGRSRGYRRRETSPGAAEDCPNGQFFKREAPVLLDSGPGAPLSWPRFPILFAAGGLRRSRRSPRGREEGRSAHQGASAVARGGPMRAALFVPFVIPSEARDPFIGTLPTKSRGAERGPSSLRSSG